MNNAQAQETSQDNQGMTELCSLQYVVIKSFYYNTLTIYLNSLLLLASSRKAVGVQTEIAAEATGMPQSVNQHARQNLSVKLLSIWDPQSDQKVGAGLVSKILIIFDGLFRRINAEVSSQTKLDPVADGALNDLGCLRNPQSLSASDASKLTTFYSVLVQVITSHYSFCY